MDVGYSPNKKLCADDGPSTGRAYQTALEVVPAGLVRPWDTLVYGEEQQQRHGPASACIFILTCEPGGNSPPPGTHVSCSLVIEECNPRGRTPAVRDDSTHQSIPAGKGNGNRDFLPLYYRAKHRTFTFGELAEYLYIFGPMIPTRLVDNPSLRLDPPETKAINVIFPRIVAYDYGQSYLTIVRETDNSSVSGILAS